MFRSHKSFPFFYTEKKGRKNNSLSHTQQLLQELLNMNFLLALCLLPVCLVACSLPHRVQRLEKRQLCEVW